MSKRPINTTPNSSNKKSKPDTIEDLKDEIKTLKKRDEDNIRFLVESNVNLVNELEINEKLKKENESMKTMLKSKRDQIISQFVTIRKSKDNLKQSHKRLEFIASIRNHIINHIYDEENKYIQNDIEDEDISCILEEGLNILTGSKEFILGKTIYRGVWDVTYEYLLIHYENKEYCYYPKSKQFLALVLPDRCNWKNGEYDE